jgi:hypothetical protein
MAATQIPTAQQIAEEWEARLALLEAEDEPPRRPQLRLIQGGA